MSFVRLNKIVKRRNYFINAFWNWSILFSKLGIMYYWGILALDKTKFYSPVFCLLNGGEIITLLLYFFLSDLVFSKPINKSLLGLILSYIKESCLFLLFSQIIFLVFCRLRCIWWVFISFIEIFDRSPNGILVKWLFWDYCLDCLHIFKESWSFSVFQMYKSWKLIVYLLLFITVFWHKWNIQILRPTILFTLFLTMNSFLKSESSSLLNNFGCGT